MVKLENKLKPKKKKIGILGGTFDPAHKGHLEISKQAKTIFQLKNIIWAITKQNPFKDESKSNLEVTAEVLGHLLLTLLGLFFIDRIITYVPTYSGRNHGTFNIFSVLLIILIFAYEANTKVGTKMKLLIERVSELWHGKKEDAKPQKGNNSVVKVSQPISRGGMPTHQASRADYLNSHNAMVSPTQMLPPANEPQQETSGDGNNMYNNGGFNGLVNAQGPNAQNEPMAANDGISAFSGF